MEETPLSEFELHSALARTTSGRTPCDLDLARKVDLRASLNRPGVEAEVGGLITGLADSLFSGWLEEAGKVRRTESVCARTLGIEVTDNAECDIERGVRGIVEDDNAETLTVTADWDVDISGGFAIGRDDEINDKSQESIERSLSVVAW